jgi:uncharacterized protein (DUF2336 family)
MTPPRMRRSAGTTLMIVRKFLTWAQNSPPAARAEGAGALARAWLYSDLSGEQRREVLVALTALIDDSAVAVRQALSTVFASTPHAPRHIVSMLAADQAEVALPVLARSPLLSDAELIDCAALGQPMAQCAVASRAPLSPPVCAALAEVGCREAAVVLARNAQAEISLASLRRLLERFWDDGAVREAILGRPHLPVVLRAELVAATARALSAFVTACAWLPEERAHRATREAAERAHLIIAGDDVAASDQGLRDFVFHLRTSGQLTPGFILRALLAGHLALCETALADLSGLPRARVAGLMRNARNVGFGALFTRAGLPVAILPAFRAALAAYEDAGLPDVLSSRLSRRMIERALTACESMDPADCNKVLALLRRFEAEAALEEAREEVGRMVGSVPMIPDPRQEIVIDLAAIEAEIFQAA